MPRIKILPIDLRNKIAAGEVIERPASVVKELIENALDAESTEIKIEVLDAGKKMIKVTDNGIGMDKDDALLCLERHATSKIINDSDLFNIKTLGFRGEALPSIASVSKIRLITGQKGSDSGISIEIAGGDIKEIRDSAFSGTSVEVKDLFFNTPARKKFLKTKNTELFHIIDTVTKEALSHHEVGFKLLTENQETILLPKASEPKERIMQIYGNEFLQGLTEINNEQGGMKLKAFVSHAGNYRNNKAHQFIFINKRPIKDFSLSHAIYNAYEGMIPKEKHPVFFLFLELNPKKVDFNVHPTKKEVRFEDKESVYRFATASVGDVIRGQRTEFTKSFVEAPNIQARPMHYNPSWQTSSEIAEPMELAYKPSLSSIFLGDVFVAVSGKAGLTLIDHHAAHERILYEKLLKKIGIISHRLLFPQQINLSPKEYIALLENKDSVLEFGIEFSDFGHNTIIIHSLPDLLSDADLRGILTDVASALIEGASPNKTLKEEIASRIACHSSVRGRNILSQEEISNLVFDLEKTENPDYCPHGRPTRIFFSIDDMKKMFKRK